MAQQNVVAAAIGPVLASGLPNQHGIGALVLTTFRGENFFLFKARVQAELRTFGLWNVMSGVEERPAEEAENGAKAAAWDKKEEVCKSVLFRAVTDDVLLHIVDKQTSCEM